MQNSCTPRYLPNRKFWGYKTRATPENTLPTMPEPRPVWEGFASSPPWMACRLSGALGQKDSSVTGLIN